MLPILIAYLILSNIFSIFFYVDFLVCYEFAQKKNGFKKKPFSGAGVSAVTGGRVCSSGNRAGGGRSRNLRGVGLFDSCCIPPAAQGLLRIWQGLLGAFPFAVLRGLQRRGMRTIPPKSRLRLSAESACSNPAPKSPRRYRPPTRVRSLRCNLAPSHFPSLNALRVIAAPTYAEIRFAKSSFQTSAK